MKLFASAFLGGLVVIHFAGCSPHRPTPAVSLPPTRPFLEVQPRAAEILRKIAADQGLSSHWRVRLDVVWKPDPLIEVRIEATPPTAADLEVEAAGLTFVLASSQKPYLTGSYVQLVQEADRFRFEVTFPNQNEQERAAASDWLRTERARREKRDPNEP